ncbi:MAG: hypothetical protein L3J47_00455 [Sulfurovum sp.]|nr:hypothetical protein [Sulfurovum sp.]
MATSGGRFVTFGGRTLWTPGGATKINTKALSPVGLSAQGVVAVLGEADDGKAGEVIVIDDPSLAKDLFRSGPLADSIRVAFDPSNDIRIPGGAQRVLAYKVNVSAQASTSLQGDAFVVTDTAAVASTSSVVNLTIAGLTIDEQIGRWLLWDGGTSGVSQLRRITDNDASSITVSPPFAGLPVATDVVNVMQNQIELTSQSYGISGNSLTMDFEDGAADNKFVVSISDGITTETSTEILGDSAMNVRYGGGPIEDAGGVVANATTTGFDVDVVVAPALDAWAGMLVRFSNGLQREIVTNTAADPSVVVLAANNDLSVLEIASLAGATAQIIDVTSATMTLTGANGKATGLTTAVLPTADNETVAFLPNETLSAFASRLNATTNFSATVPAGVNGDVVLMSEFDFGTAATAVDVRFDAAKEPTTSGHFRRDLHELVLWINTFSELASATRSNAAAAEGSELPSVNSLYFTEPVAFTGGARGSSSNADWQAAFDALGNVRANHIVPLISEDLVNQGNSSSATLATVAAQLLSHVQQMATTGKSERGGYIGHKANLANMKLQAANLGSADVQYYAQRLTLIDVDGNLKEMDEWSQALSAAGMRSGAEEVGEPLTFKKLKTTGLTQDASWGPADQTVRNSLVEAGIMFAEEAPNGGFRWVRDLTTYVADDNVTLIDGNTRDAVRFIAYDLRTSIEARFTGEKALPATVASTKEFISNKMSLYKDDNIIVMSDDPENPTGVNFIPGYRRLRVGISGNTMSIKVEIFPVVGVVFQLTDIFLQLPVIS